MASISDFVSSFNHGARANLFKVEIPYLGEKMKFFCKAASIPGMSFDNIPVNYQNNTLNIAGDINFQPWQLTIINDKDFLIRKHIERWMNAIKVGYGTSGATSIKEIFKTVYVYQLDEEGDEIMGYTLNYCYPSNLGEIALSFDSQNIVEEYTLEIVYSFWERNGLL
jgi:hypothetical protein